jgi:hypothetical protein
MTDYLDVVPVWTDDKRSIVVRVIVSSDAGRAIVSATRSQGATIELVDLTASLRREGKVKGYRFFPGRTEPERRLAATAEPYGIGNLHCDADAEWGKCLKEESLAHPQVADANANMIEHGFLLSSWM